MNENGDLRIPNPLHSCSGLSSLVIVILLTKYINISLIVLLVGLFIIIKFGPPICHCFNTLSHIKRSSHIKRFRMSQNRALI